MSIRFILGFVIGLMLGAAIATALASQSGASARHQVWDKVKEHANEEEPAG